MSAKFAAHYPFLTPAHAARLFRMYGTRAQWILGNAADYKDLGQHFGADLYEVEVRYMMVQEWALTAEDVVWRRSKRGLVMTEQEIAALDQFMKAETGYHEEAV